MKKFAVLFATIICFAMISGSFAATNLNTENCLTTVKANQVFVITVPCNPSTGYHWVSNYDKNNVKLLSKNYISFEPLLCGSGGYNFYKFYGKVGSKITLKYIGPGKDGKIVEIKEYNIK